MTGFSTNSKLYTKGLSRIWEDFPDFEGLQIVPWIAKSLWYVCLFFKSIFNWKSVFIFIKDFVNVFKGFDMKILKL